MAKIDTSGWKEFRVSDLFDVLPVKHKLSKSDIDVNGTIPVYSSEKTNNGIIGYTNVEFEYEVSDAIPMYVVFGDHTCAMHIVYTNFSVMDNVKVLVPKIDGMERVLFVLTVWYAAIPKLGYARHWNCAKNVCVTLPATPTGEPDWDYMDKYMSEVMKTTEASLSALRRASGEKHAVDVSDWKEFRVSDLFEISRPIARSQSKYADGNIAFVASGNFNNGVAKWCKPEADEVLDRGNCITVSPLDGSSFYQKESFLGRGGAGSAILILRNKNLLEHAGLFISSVIRQSLTTYTYSDQLSLKTIEEQVIRLPIDDLGEPDWEYMDKYMSQMMRGVNRNLDVLRALKIESGLGL